MIHFNAQEPGGILKEDAPQEYEGRLLFLTVDPSTAYGEEIISTCQGNPGAQIHVTRSDGSLFVGTLITSERENQGSMYEIKLDRDAEPVDALNEPPQDDVQPVPDVESTDGPELTDLPEGTPVVPRPPVELSGNDVGTSGADAQPE